MQFRQHHNDLAKTLSFGVIHLMLAISIGWLLSGNFVFGALLALVEPLCNTVVSHQISKRLKKDGPSKKHAMLTSALIGIAHLVVAIALAKVLTGSFVTAWAYAVVEPVANAVAHYFFEGWWQSRRRFVSQSNQSPRSPAWPTQATTATGQASLQVIAQGAMLLLSVRDGDAGPPASRSLR